ncbi:hypothetical protein KIN20_001208 [Parelaphostrongylus tenuis]|uniref:Uncharacterized protein n=1 Tax=Parelaphostrongylus tenuis TaxID=148309 RepID=A0AAD5LVU9_PARTN|nr:hypothetical protein KIN20_001208 [Parelaphostrongylus tenuis]
MEFSSKQCFSEDRPNCIAKKATTRAKDCGGLDRTILKKTKRIGTLVDYIFQKLRETGLINEKDRSIGSTLMLVIPTTIINS